MGPFCILFMVSALNLLCRYLLPSLGMSGGELLVVYSIIASSAALSSSGQLHFIVPTVTAVFHYATNDNAWAGTFQRFIPDWIAEKNPKALEGFYKGQATPIGRSWLPQMGAWIGFMLSVAFATLCIVSLLRRAVGGVETSLLPDSSVAACPDGG